jgi:hypothetical protein
MLARESLGSPLEDDIADVSCEAPCKCAPGKCECNDCPKSNKNKGANSCGWVSCHACCA